MKKTGCPINHIISWRKSPRIIRYLVTGGANTIIGYAIFSLCYINLNTQIPHWAILVISHLLAVSFSFITQGTLVFGDSLEEKTIPHILHAWWRFQYSYLGLLAIGLTLNMLALTWITPSPWLAQIFAMLFSLPFAYLIHRHFVFRPGVRRS